MTLFNANVLNSVARAAIFASSNGAYIFKNNQPPSQTKTKIALSRARARLRARARSRFHTIARLARALWRVSACALARAIESRTPRALARAGTIARLRSFPRDPPPRALVASPHPLARARSRERWHRTPIAWAVFADHVES